ncbi:hypothetical protein PSEUDO8Z_180003 [Pseudomonas sp. 8Z]|nr:hypothetical protein PSEUDO8Z_180003 [Pseudomonas sp. 8Z]
MGVSQSETYLAVKPGKKCPEAGRYGRFWGVEGLLCGSQTL